MGDGGVKIGFSGKQREAGLDALLKYALSRHAFSPGLLKRERQGMLTNGL